MRAWPIRKKELFKTYRGYRDTKASFAKIRFQQFKTKKKKKEEKVPMAIKLQGGWEVKALVAGPLKK